MRIPFSFLKSTGGGAAAPVITSVDPDVGNVAGGHLGLMTITGTDFVSGCTVTVGGTSATSVTFVNSTTVTCNPPAKASGLHNVVLTNPDTQTSGSSGNNLYRAWSPDELTGVLFWWSILTGLTITSGKIEQWNDEGPNARGLWNVAGNRPVYNAGPPADGQWQAPDDYLSLYTDTSLGTLLRVVYGGTGISAFWCANYTSSDTSTSQANINCPLTVMGDGSGWGSLGHSGDALALAQFTGSNQVSKGSGLNDGQWRHMGWTIFANGGSSEAKAYHGATQQGTTHTFSIDTSNLAFNQLGASYTAADGFDGKIRSFGAMAGVASATELSRWHKWDRLTHGAIA